MEEWWKKPVRVIQFNIEDRYGRYVSKINGKQLVELAKRLHANVLVIFARDPWGRIFYRGGRAGKEHPKMVGDIVREAVEEGRRIGVKVVVMVGHTANKYLYHLHSDWAQVNRNGEIIVLEHIPFSLEHYEPEWPQLCINSPFIEHVKKEVVEAHSLGVDGVFLDSFRYQPDIERACYCEWCRRRFREEHGYEMPKEPNWLDKRWRELWEWRYKVVVERIKELYKLSKEIDPGKVFMYNSHPGGWAGRTNRVVEEARNYIDVVFAECSEADHQPPGFITEMTKLTRAMSGGKPVWSSRNYFHLYRTVMSTTPIVIKQGLREAVLGGGSPWALIFSISYFQDPSSLDAIGEVFKQYEEIEEYLEDTEPYRFAGILVSNHTRDYYGREHPERYVDGIRGMYYALIHSHIPVEFISEKDAVNPDYLSKYKVLIVPNTVCLSEEIGDSIKEYVRRGGKLLSTYLSSTRDKYCIRRYDFYYPEVIGARFIGVLRKPWTYLILDLDKKHPLFNNVKTETILWGDMSYEFIASRTTPNIGWHTMLDDVIGEVLGYIGLSSTDWGHEYTLGRSPPALGALTKLPGIILNNYGEGKSLYFTGQLGRHYWRIGLPIYKKLIENSILYLGGEPDIQVIAPETVHSEIFVQGERIIIHLLNHTYNQRIMAKGIGRVKQPLPPYGSVDAVHPAREIVPVNGVEIKIKNKMNNIKAYTLISRKNLEIKTTRNQLQIRLDKLDDYEIVVVEPRK